MGWTSLTQAQQQFLQRYLDIDPEAFAAGTGAGEQADMGGTTVKAAVSRRLPELQALEAGLDGLLAEFGPEAA